MNDIEASQLERFWSKVDVRGENECWPWLAGTRCSRPTSVAYGSFRGFTGKMEFAHRVVYRLTKGDIPQGLLVRHKCDVGVCCNPNHLELGTHLENAQDRENRGRSARLRGSKHGNSKLNERQVQAIKRSLHGGQSMYSLAKQYEVSTRTIMNIRDGAIWRHVKI